MSGNRGGPQIDVTQASFTDAILSFSEAINRSDAVGLFYYTGDAASYGGKNYLLPVEANPETPAHYVWRAGDASKPWRQSIAYLIFWTF
jgi:uncharacterized caspase-like protein